MPYYHKISACDGSSYRVFATRDQALASVGDFLGRSVHSAHSRFYDDSGGVHTVGECPGKISTAEELRAYERAFDARETGTATPEQIALLESE